MVDINDPGLIAAVDQQRNKAVDAVRKAEAAFVFAQDDTGWYQSSFTDGTVNLVFLASLTLQAGAFVEGCLHSLPKQAREAYNEILADLADNGPDFSNYLSSDHGA